MWRLLSSVVMVEIIKNTEVIDWIGRYFAEVCPQHMTTYLYLFFSFCCFRIVDICISHVNTSHVCDSRKMCYFWKWFQFLIFPNLHWFRMCEDWKWSSLCVPNTAMYCSNKMSVTYRRTGKSIRKTLFCYGYKGHQHLTKFMEQLFFSKLRNACFAGSICMSVIIFLLI